MEVRRVKALLTVPDRWGSFTSAGLTGVDMVAEKGRGKVDRWVRDPIQSVNNEQSKAILYYPRQNQGWRVVVWLKMNNLGGMLASVAALRPMPMVGER